MAEPNDDPARTDETSYEFSGGAKDGERVPLKPGELLPAAIQVGGRAAIGTHAGYYLLGRDNHRYVWTPGKHPKYDR